MKTSSETKIPTFLSKSFNSLATKEEKTEEVQNYKQWYSHRFTQSFIEGVEKQLEDLIKEDEKITSVTEFDFTQKLISNRAKRLALRDLIKKLDWKL